MHIACKKCGKTTSIESNFEARYFGCPYCRSLFEIKEELSLVKEFEHKPLNPILDIGRKGIINGKEYEIVSMFVKKFHAIHYWREYTLKSKDDHYLYLSESEGHWILLEEIPDKFNVSRKYKRLTYNEVSYDLYENTHCRVESAYGFFDEEIPQTEIQIIEYIKPPYIVSIEKLEKEQKAYFGRHFSKREIKKAFGNPELPGKFGVGSVQPFLFNFYNVAIIFCCTAILILLTQLFMNNSRGETAVFSKTFSFTEYNNKDFVSESFILEGASAPLTVLIHSEVDNSWANAQVTLVNENTNEEESASQDIEYYHGYTDGENWSEGDRSEEFNICGVGQGKYHLVITPQK